MRNLLARAAVLLLMSLLALLAGCGGATRSSGTPPAASPAPSPAPPASAAPALPQLSHVVLVVEENHSYEQVIGNAAMPFLNRLASQNALAAQYFANAHPSLPDYFMMTTGQVITTDNAFPGPVSADNIVRELVTAGKTWKSYAESLPSPGYVGGDVFPYLRRHNPFAYLSDVIGTAQANNVVPFSQLAADMAAGQLPNFSFVIPNALHCAHNCPDGTESCDDNLRLNTADSWLQQNITPLLSDTNFQKSGVLIVVFEEGQVSDTAGGGGHVAMVMAGSAVKKGFQSAAQHDHAALLRTVLEILGVPRFPGAAATAADMAEFF